ncbi:hypothetical protein ACQKPT_26295 [Pseudomonas monteilii]|uniref:hypothetical protein n=1 Tax=Pseudomonas monteilii TaxID=76759 RepID=UPI003D07BBCC
MRYIVTGKVLPERADISFRKVKWDAEDDGSVTAVCDASQITLVLDLASIDGWLSAHIIAEHFAMIVVGALGFSLGSGYSVELINVIAEDGTSHILGVRPTDPDGHGTTLGFAPHDSALVSAFTLATSNIFFRLALRDYSRAINDASDCPTYCYRAIESIMSHFAFEANIENGWRLMHAALGTEKSQIEDLIKSYADPIRHGNWITAHETTHEIRWKMLSLTREILEKFMNYKSMPS